MPHFQHQQRSVVPPGYPYGASSYPGLTPYDPSIPFESSSLVPYTAPLENAAAPTVLPAASPAKSGGGLSLPKLGDLKGIIDKMGGIDGVISTMGQVQKVMQGIQQFAPMAKLFMGLLPGGKGKTTGASSGKLDEFRPKRKRSRSSKSGSKKKKTGSGSSSRSTSKSQTSKKKTRR
ncbi:hypothetical protein [Paenibacillus sp. J22TS3]|uniref:hypothetical protein n=1 Tax=Paenibacillus sp. J22TS3 TaxID=2807192 RepID=UPI001B09F49D|nr:hypothetical protein [Paenibacillus sp. J22TS3]GIP22971.1 hypothetical protein J22TS3_32460 [Paenibacillus sp. J22TS3]